MKEKRYIVDIKRKNGQTICCPYCKKKVGLKFLKTEEPKEKDKPTLVELLTGW